MTGGKGGRVKGEEGKTTFTTTRSATSITAGWVDSVPRGFRRVRKRRRLQQRGEQRQLGGKRGKRRERVKRLTVCYHGNATPLRLEESLNPARYGPCRLSQYTPSTAFSPRKSKARRSTRATKRVQEERERAVRGWGWWRPDYAANSVFTPKCFHRALPIYGIYRVNSTCSLSSFLSLLKFNL